MTSYGLLGVGSIASALVTGLCDGVERAPSVVLSPRNAERAADLSARMPTVEVAPDNQAVVDRADVVIVCLRAAVTEEVLSELRFGPGQAVVSAVPGFPVERLRALVAPAAEIARSIPLPAVATRTSITPVHPATPAAVELYDRLGGVLPIDDELAYEAVTAASATVAGHFRYLGTIAAWMAERGIPEREARRYVADTFAALGDELASPEADFDALAAAHATPGGLNEQLADDLTRAGVYDAVRAGLDAVLGRIAPD